MQLKKFSKMYRQLESCSYEELLLFSDAYLAANNLNFDVPIKNIRSYCLQQGLTFNLLGHLFTFDPNSMTMEITEQDGCKLVLVDLLEDKLFSNGDASGGNSKSNDPAIENLIAYCNKKKIPTPEEVFILPSPGTQEGCPNSSDSNNPQNCSNFYTWDNFSRAVKLFNTYAIPYEELCWGGTGGGGKGVKCGDYNNAIDCNKHSTCGWAKITPEPNCICHAQSYIHDNPGSLCPTPAPAPTPVPAPTPPVSKKRLFLKYGITDDENITNLKIVTAFFSSVFKETFYKSCKEHTDPSNGGLCSSCDGGKPSDYIQSGQACGCSSCVEQCCTDLIKNTKCTDWLNWSLTKKNCWFGRGAVQLSYLGGYGKVAEVLKNLPINEILPDMDKETKFNTYFIQNPDTICTNGVIAFLTSIAYFSTFTITYDMSYGCHLWMRGEKEVDGYTIADKCVKGGGSSNAPCRGYIYNDALTQFKIPTTSNPKYRPTTSPCEFQYDPPIGCCTPKQYFSKSDKK